MRKTVALIAMLLAAGSAAAAGPHQHGVARMQVAVEGNAIELEFTSPLENLVGFEHAPRNDKQRKALQAMKDSFGKPETLLLPTAAAGCRPQPAKLTLPEHGHGHGHGHKDDEHADLHATIVFQCDAPAALKGMELKMFEVFPRLQQVKVELIAGGKQSAAVLNRQQRRLGW